MTHRTAAPPDASALPDVERPGRGLRRRAGQAAGAVLVLAGAALPFVLGGPFGDDDGTPKAAPAPSPSAPSAPSTSSGAPVPSASSPTSPAAVTATVPPTAPTARGPQPAPTGSGTPPARTPPARTPSAPDAGPTGEPVDDRAGQVFVDPGEYVGEQASVARVGLASDGVLTTTTYEYSDTELTGTVLRMSPTGWVPDGTVVELVVAL